MKVGDKVEANWKVHGAWYRGTIAQTRLDGSYDINYDDGRIEPAVRAEQVRALGAAKTAVSADQTARIEEGTTVEANYRGGGSFSPGRVKKDNRDGTYDIDYNDGDKEVRVPTAMIRLVAAQLVRLSLLFVISLSSSMYCQNIFHSNMSIYDETWLYCS